MEAREKAREAELAARKRAGVTQGLAARLGKRYAPNRATLAAFRVEYHEQAHVRKVIEEIITAGTFDRGIVLYGSVGTGKDHLLAALLYAAAEAGRTAKWANGQEIYGRFRDAMDSKVSEESLLREFTKPDVLGISDPIPPVIDPSRPSAWRTELLFRVLDGRYRDCKPTWVTLNAQSPDDAQRKLSEPVFDRIRHDAILIPCFWPSFREAAK